MDMKMGDSISKELISHLVLLEEKHQSKVLAYIKSLLGNEILTSDEEKAMNDRAEASEQDIASGRVINASQFKQDFDRWKKKKMTAC